MLWLIRKIRFLTAQPVNDLQKRCREKESTLCNSKFQNVYSYEVKALNHSRNYKTLASFYDTLFYAYYWDVVPEAWYGDCAPGSECETCTNNNELSTSFDWEEFGVGGDAQCDTLATGGTTGATTGATTGGDDGSDGVGHNGGAPGRFCTSLGGNAANLLFWSV